jgi:hypothetical protein
MWSTATGGVRSLRAMCTKANGPQPTCDDAEPAADHAWARFSAPIVLTQPIMHGHFLAPWHYCEWQVEGADARPRQTGLR